MTVFPAVDGPSRCWTSGANPEVRPEHLVQFAIMGVAYAERVLGLTDPRVGLISIGEERGKGTSLVRAAPFLEAAPLRFIGNIEGQDVPLGGAEVAVTDGFTGNVMLKLAEGIASLVTTTLKRRAPGRTSSAPSAACSCARRSAGSATAGTTGATAARCCWACAARWSSGTGDRTRWPSRKKKKGAIAVARRGVEHKLVDAIAEGIAALSPPEDAAVMALDGA
ncbi:MAG: hypothetical protein U0470_14330 [Anaerolineae bacterium]